MASSLEISVVVSTYQRPEHLRRCLASLAAQQHVAGQFETIVVDDGSTDETADVVAAFRREAPFPVKFCTHPHDGFQLARCRNSGIRASTAPYLLFTDGDCIFPPNHLRRHLDARRRGVVRSGDCVRLTEATSRLIDETAVRERRFLELIDRKTQRSLRRAYGKALIYQAARNRQRPKLTGWNMAVWREQLERINGFDEQFRGWGCEDDDLALRLRKSGARIATALGYTHAYHLWHPPHATAPQRWHDGQNVGYFQRPAVLTRCLEGIRSRSLLQVSTRVIGSRDEPQISRQLAGLFRASTTGVELELMVWPGEASFTPRAECRVMLAPVGANIAAAARRTADAVLEMNFSFGAAAVLQGLQRLLEGRPADRPEPAQAA